MGDLRAESGSTVKGYELEAGFSSIPPTFGVFSESPSTADPWTALSLSFPVMTTFDFGFPSVIKAIDVLREVGGLLKCDGLVVGGGIDMLALYIPPFIRPASADRPFLFAFADTKFDGRRERDVVRDLRRGGFSSFPLLDGVNGEGESDVSAESF